MNTSSDPLLVQPRLDAKPWGGLRLAHFGIDLRGESSIGEAVLTSNDAVVAQGEFAGETIGDLVARDPERLLGPGARRLRSTGFPLLVKLIDAHENLSIQVHPTDALAPPDDCGKTEAWYILEAAPGAAVYAGLVEGIGTEQVRERLEHGESIVPLLRRIEVEAGDVLYLPAGTIHALGAGIVLYEIQQQSAITYRLEDWGRAREMHIEQGLAALNPDHRPSVVKVGTRPHDNRSQPVVRCEYFSLEVIEIGVGEQVEFGSESGPQVFTCVFGNAAIRAGQRDLMLDTGATAILFANAGPARLTSLGGARVLRGWIGD